MGLTTFANVFMLVNRDFDRGSALGRLPTLRSPRASCHPSRRPKSSSWRVLPEMVCATFSITPSRPDRRHAPGLSGLSSTSAGVAKAARIRLLTLAKKALAALRRSLQADALSQAYRAILMSALAIWSLSCDVEQTSEPRR